MFLPDAPPPRATHAHPCVLGVQGGEVVVYGCLSGKAPDFPWQAWVFRNLKVGAPLAPCHLQQLRVMVGFEAG